MIFTLGERILFKKSLGAESLAIRYHILINKLLVSSGVKGFYNQKLMR